MIFFYVGIGLAMMTTVISIFETSTTINKNQYLTRGISIDSEKSIIRKQNDKKFLQMLNDIKGISLDSGEQICQNLKSGFTDKLDSNHAILSNYSILNNYNPGIPSYTSHSRLKNGCDLVNNSHRVIIVPSSIESNTYNLYSCIIDVEPKCSFELVN
tara:strand:- start:148 stop:618 length:471 start_codon:yes stop_codon:yes gene_type:complete